MSHSRIVLVFAAVCLAVGCAGPSVVQTSVDPYTQIASLYDYGAGGRDLRLVVQGDPFGLPPGVVARAVEAAAEVGTQRQPTHLALAPGPTARPNFSVVLAFSAALTVDGDALCRGGGEQSAGTAGRLRVVGAFCVSVRARTEAVGEVNADGPADPRFVALIRQLLLALFRSDLPSANGRG